MKTPTPRLRICRTVFSQLVLFTVLLTASCSSKTIVASWVDPVGEFKAENILVVGIAHRETVRKLFENSFVEDFEKEKIQAVSSYTVARTKDAPDYDAILQAVEETGTKTVLVTRLAGIKEKTNTQMALGREYMVFEQAEMASIFMNPNPTYSTNTKVKLNLEARLYDVASRKLVWSATSKVSDPVMTKKYIDKVTDLFIEDMKKNNLL